MLFKQISRNTLIRLIHLIRLIQFEFSMISQEHSDSPDSPWVFNDFPGTLWFAWFTWFGWFRLSLLIWKVSKVLQVVCSLASLLGACGREGFWVISSRAARFVQFRKPCRKPKPGTLLFSSPDSEFLVEKHSGSIDLVWFGLGCIKLSETLWFSWFAWFGWFGLVVYKNTRNTLIRLIRLIRFESIHSEVSKGGVPSGEPTQCLWEWDTFWVILRGSIWSKCDLIKIWSSADSGFYNGKIKENSNLVNLINLIKGL